jgi:Caspase domain
MSSACTLGRPSRRRAWAHRSAAAALVCSLIGLPAGPVQAEGARPGPSRNYDPRRWAVVIGVNNYTQSQALSPLRGPGNDAQNLTEVLINHGRFDPSHVLVLAEGTETPPTNDNITIAFSRVAKEVPADGLLVIFFAGHGIAPANEAYLLPSNVVDVEDPESQTFRRSALPVSLVREFIEKCRAQHVILFIDACRNDPSRPLGRGMVPEVKHSEAMQKALIWQPDAGAPVRNVVTFFSSHPGQESFETGETSGKRSVGYFTDTLVRALSGKVTQALQQPDGIVTINTLYGFLTKEVPRRVAKDFPGRKQNPFMFQSGGEDVALTFPGTHVPPQQAPSAGEPAEVPEEKVGLRLRLPLAALNDAALIVTRNHYIVPRGALDDALPVVPGKQYVQVKLPHYKDWARDVDVSGGTIDVPITLQPRNSPVLMGLGVAAGGAVAIAAGTYFGLRASALGDEVTKTCAGGCTWEGPVNEKDQQGRRYSTYSTILFATGVPVALAGLGWAAYWHWSLSPLEPEAGSVALSPLPGGGEIALRRTF